MLPGLSFCFPLVSNGCVRLSYRCLACNYIVPGLKCRSLLKLHLVATNACSVHRLFRKLQRFYGEYLQAYVIYLLLSINRLKLCYFGTKDSGFCRPFPLHIINFNAGEYLLVGHVVSLYVDLLICDVTFLLLGYVIS